MKYPKEVKEFVTENVTKYTNKELASLTNEKFGTNFTNRTIREYRDRHKIPGKPVKGYWNPSKYPKDLEDYMRSIIAGRPSEEIKRMINEKYGYEVFETEGAFRAYRHNHKLVSGVDAKFKKGNLSYTKGKKQQDYMSPEALERTKKTRFKKGQPPVNWKDVGYTRIDADGYILIKVKNKGTQRERWKFLHQVVWEREKGPVPKGHIITFKDGNKTNCNIDNLLCVSRAQNIVMTRKKLRSTEPEITETGATLAKLIIETSKRRKE